MDTDLETAVGLLVALEYPFNHSRCLICSGWMAGPNGETDYAHNKSCVLGKFLAKHAPNRPIRTWPVKRSATPAPEKAS